MSNQNAKKSPGIAFTLFNSMMEIGMDNFGYLNSALHFYFVKNLQKKFMAYVRLQMNLPNSPNTSQHAFCWTATPPPSVRTIRMTPLHLRENSLIILHVILIKLLGLYKQ